MYLVKAQRTFGNHQYVLGFCEDLDIAHFHGYNHGRYERADKYTYTIEEVPWVIPNESRIISWETEGELAAYRVFSLGEGYNINKLKEELKDQYRIKDRLIEPMDYHIEEDDLIFCCSNWYFYEGQVLVGLRKIYQYFRDNDKDNKFWDKFYKSQKDGYA